MNTQTYIIVFIIGVIALLTFCVIGLYNKIVNSKNIVNDKWDEINKQLDKKIKLLSKLIEVIKEYNETEDITSFLETKNKLTNAKSINDRILANDKMNKVLHEFNNLDNKKMKEDKKYIEYNKELNETEDKIEYAKEFYNEVAKKHNSLIKKIPYNIVATCFNFKRYNLFEQ